MRLFEILLVLCVVLNSLRLFFEGRISFSKKRSFFLLLSIFTLISIAGNLILDGFRWHMFPLIIVALLFTIFNIYLFFRMAESPVKTNKSWQKILKIAGRVLIFLFSVTAAAIPALSPIPELPEPNGPYKVGTFRFELTDKSREEKFSNKSNEYRKIIVRAWYPAEITENAEKAPYAFYNRELEAAFADFQRGYMKDILNIKMPIPTELIGVAYSQMKTFSYLNVSVDSSEPNYPVLIYNHGYISHHTAFTALVEELASNGYIIFSINHPYESTLTVFEDGSKAVYIFPEQTPRELLDQEKKDIKLKKLFNEISSAEKTEDKIKIAEEINKNTYLYRDVKPKLDFWVDDTRFLLDQLFSETIPEVESVLNNRMDLKRIGVLGHSFGGGTSRQVSIEDPRIKACISIDGIRYGSLDVVPVPTMLFHSTDNALYEQRTLNMLGPDEYLFTQAHKAIYELTISGSAHTDYSDAGLLPMNPSKGSIDIYLLFDICRTYSTAFFDKHLKGLDQPILSRASSDYEEVKMRIKNY